MSLALRVLLLFPIRCYGDFAATNRWGIWLNLSSSRSEAAPSPPENTARVEVQFTFAAPTKQDLVLISCGLFNRFITIQRGTDVSVV